MKQIGYLLNFLMAGFTPAFCQPESGITFQHLFEGGTKGYQTYRIPGIVVTQKGTLLAWCEARKEKGDWADIDILMRRSTDGGKTWNEPVVLADAQEAEDNDAVTASASVVHGETEGATANNPVMIVDSNGLIHFIHCVEYSKAYYQYSSDDGLSFSSPVEITSVFEQFRDRYPWKVIATGPGHGIQLDSERLLVPLWMSTGEGANGHRPSVVATIYSDNHGKSWQAGDIAIQHQAPFFYATGQPQVVINPSETVAVQLADGRVMLNARTESPEHFRVTTVSKDGIADWSTPRFDTALYDPVCLASVVRLTETPAYRQNRILFANPDSQSNPRKIGNSIPTRQNLTVKMSYDEGKTWPVEKVIEPGISAYSDMAVAADKTIYLLFENQGMENNQYHSKYLTLATFTVAWLTGGKDSIR